MKLYADDVIEPHTALMLEDYANRPGVRGRPELSGAENSVGVHRRARPDGLPDPHACDGRCRDPARARRDRAGGPGERHPRPAARNRARRVPAPRRPAPVPCARRDRGDAAQALLARPRRRHLDGERAARSAGIAPGGSAACSIRARRSRSRATGRSARWTRSSGSTRRRPVQGWTARIGWTPDERVGLDRALQAYTVHGARAWHAEGDRGRISARVCWRIWWCGRVICTPMRNRPTNCSTTTPN